jgi:hypothetical protein
VYPRGSLPAVVPLVAADCSWGRLCAFVLVLSNNVGSFGTGGLLVVLSWIAQIFPRALRLGLGRASRVLRGTLRNSPRRRCTFPPFPRRGVVLVFSGSTLCGPSIDLGSRGISRDWHPCHHCCLPASSGHSLPACPYGALGLLRWVPVLLFQSGLFGGNPLCSRPALLGRAAEVGAPSYLFLPFVFVCAILFVGAGMYIDPNPPPRWSSFTLVSLKETTSCRVELGLRAEGLDFYPPDQQALRPTPQPTGERKP